MWQRIKVWFYVVLLKREPREYPRFQWQYPFQPGDLFLRESDKPINYRLRDYSVAGIGFVTADQILPETELIFKIGDVEVEMTLIWGLAQNDKKGSYRYGINTTNKHVNLKHLIERQLHSACQKKAS